MKAIEEMMGKIEKTIEQLKKHNVEAEVVATGKEALERIKQLIPAGASVMNGASVTLKQIGYIELLKSAEHPWRNLHAGIAAEKDPDKVRQLRKQALIADYYLGSVHALTEEGEFLVASNTGSQLPHIAYSSPNVILVVGEQKLVPNMTEAFRRLDQVVVPLEDKRMREEYGVGTHVSKILLFKYENPAAKRQVRVIIVREKLGF